MIEEIDVFSLVKNKLPLPYKEEVILAANKSSLRKISQGTYIEKQYKINEWYLLILSTDAFSEVICFYLLNKEFKEIDYAEIYSSYLDSPELHAEKIKVLDGNKLCFEFLTVKPWVLTILQKPMRKIIQ